MKAVSILLLMYLGILISAPALEAMELIPEAFCCEEESDDNCEETCNPFINCHCCTGFTSQPFTSELRNNIAYIDSPSSSIYRSPINTKLTIQIWNPPKV